MAVAGETDLVALLRQFGGDPQRAEGVASFLGFEPIPAPEDRLAGALSGGLKQFLRGRSNDGFGVSELYRVGSVQAEPAEVGLWIGVLSDWGLRSSDRDRSRRRVARALVEHVPDRRSLAFLVPPPTDARCEAELLFPRTQINASNGAVTSVRALLDLHEPSRFHRELLRGLRISPGGNLLDISRTWQREFSVERVTTRFYQEYASVRDRMAEALMVHNPDHPAVKSMSDDEARTWATRQMGRVLFLWFLQAKQWLGEPGGLGSRTYLLDLWSRRLDTAEREYFRGILTPLFFDALATGSSNRGEHPVLGFVPYLNGGLFRRNAQEDTINDKGEISLPDEVFDPKNDESLLNLLSRYRFITRESTPDDQSVDPDPELLGRVFENLYQGDERHNSGTYYTPREIVHFMCREALDGYLRDETGVTQGALDALRVEATGSRDDHQPVPSVPTSKLVDVLETVRVCDPAVGSGAFLLGAIQEIVTLRRGLLFSEQPGIEYSKLYKQVSDWKRRTIEKNLYGVDVNPEAVEICRLRLWLSMVLDMDEPPAPDSGWALPNLDFQIVAGDSLVDRVAGVAFRESWPTPELQLGMSLQRDLQLLENNIAQRRREFEATHRDPHRLRELRDLIARDQREIIRLHLADAQRKAAADLARLNERRRPAKTALRRAEGLSHRLKSLLQDLESADFTLMQKPFLWPVAFPEVLREGDKSSGFDIVLANPPYVRMEKLDNEDELSYGESFPEVAASRADIFVYFYARAIQLLRPGGWLAFITSNKFMRAGYGSAVREHIRKSLRLQRIVDFGDLSVFEANGKPIAAYPAVLIGRQAEETAGHHLGVVDVSGHVRKELNSARLRANTENVRAVLGNLDDLLLRTEIGDFPQVMLRQHGWILEHPAAVDFFEDIMSRGSPLGEVVGGRIFAGVKTGRNRAFVIDRTKRDELLTEDPRSAELIRPWIKGADIERWRVESIDDFVLFVSRGVNIDDYPAVADHLKWFRRDLEKRATSSKHPWYELQQPQEGFFNQFLLPKVVWPDITRDARFALDTTGSYLDMTCFFIPNPPIWMLSTMNSALMEFLLCLSTSKLRGGFFRPKLQYVERLPVVRPDQESSEQLENLAVELLRLRESSRRVEDIERDIDGVVFDVYGLSPMERRLVLDWQCERRETFGVELPSDWRKLNALRASAGAWKGVDGEQLKQDFRASRGLGSRAVSEL